MARRCIIEAAHRRLPPALDDGSLAARRRRLLHRAEGRVLDVSPQWRDDLPAYRPHQVRELWVTEPGANVAVPPGLASPTLLTGPAAGGLAQRVAGSGPWDTIVATFTLCRAEDAATLLASLGAVLSPAGRLLVLEHVLGTGVTGALQLLSRPARWVADRGPARWCRADVDVLAAARQAGLVPADCARFTLWVGATVPAPCMAAVLRPRPTRGAP